MKNTTAEIRQAVRLDILRALKAAHPRALPVRRIRTGLVAAGFDDWNESEVASECATLVELDLAAEKPDELAVEVDRFQLTEKGRTYLAKKGL